MHNFFHHRAISSFHWFHPSACDNFRSHFMEIKLLLTLDLREQAALQAALVTHGAPDALVTLALTGACRISSVEEARQLRRWLAEARTAGETDFASLHVIEHALVGFGV
jgi:hypothetical protein